MGEREPGSAELATPRLVPAWRSSLGEDSGDGTRNAFRRQRADGRGQISEMVLEHGALTCGGEMPRHEARRATRRLRGEHGGEGFFRDAPDPFPAPIPRDLAHSAALLPR